jgi:tetratricopeptide (TPR) repeat protein
MARVLEKRVVLIAPDDVEDELDVIRAVIGQANQFRDEHLTAWNWRTDSTPGLHRAGAQGLTDEQMNISDADLVIAVFWSRLGTPVLNDTSGTAHELGIAWQAWKTTGRPAVWIYFCSRDVPQSALDDPDQFPALRRFRKSLPHEQKYSEFRTLEELQRDFAKHLRIWLKQNDPNLVGQPAVLKGVLMPPDASRLVSRPQETRRLGASFTEAPIVCLHGLPGSGKTRLAAQYIISPQRLEEHSQASLWYDVPDGGTLEELLAMLPQELVGPPGDSGPSTRSRNLLTTLRLRSGLLVLDDFHKADRKSYAPLLKVAGIQSAPGAILLLSRSALLIPDVSEVPMHSWTTAEVRQLLEKLGTRPLADEILVRLTKKTGGLPLAIKFFATLVNKYDRDPEVLLAGELTQTPLTEAWYNEIKADLSESEIALLRYLSLAEPYITRPVLRRAEARLAVQERARAFIRLQALLLVESRGSAKWAVHPFVADNTLNDTDDVTKQTMLRDLCEFSRDGIRNMHPGKMTPQSLVAGIRAVRYAQRANDADLSAEIIDRIDSAAKRLGYYQALRDLCHWHIGSRDRRDPWIEYDYAHCELILGNPQATVMVLSALDPANMKGGLPFASARILADARSQLGQRDAAISGLRRALREQPAQTRSALMSYRQAEAMLARLLIEDGRLAEARRLAVQLARTVKDPRSLGVILMLLGQLDAADSPKAAQMRFRAALAKFRSVGDRRGAAWALRSMVEMIIRQRRLDGETRRLTREAISTCAKMGESTLEYAEWLERVRPAYLDDAAILNLIDRESLRVGSDLGHSRLS